MKYFGKVVNKTNENVAVSLYGHSKISTSVVLQPDEESEIYHIDDEELVVRLLEEEIGKAKMFKILIDHSYSLLILIEIK